MMTSACVFAIAGRNAERPFVELHAEIDPDVADRARLRLALGLTPAEVTVARFADVRVIGGAGFLAIRDAASGRVRRLPLGPLHGAIGVPSASITPTATTPRRAHIPGARPLSPPKVVCRRAWAGSDPMRGMRAVSTAARPRRMLGPMPIARLSHARPAVTPDDVERERAELSDLISRRYPRAVRCVLETAARADRFNRRALDLGLPLLAAAEPIAVGGAAWAALGALYPAPSSARSGPGTRAGRPRAR